MSYSNNGLTGKTAVASPLFSFTKVGRRRATRIMQHSDPVRKILESAEERAHRSARQRTTTDILFCLVESQSNLTRKPLQQLKIDIAFIERLEQCAPGSENPEAWEEVLQEATTIAIASGAAQLRSDTLLVALTVVQGVAHQILESKSQDIRECFPGIIVPTPEENARFVEELDEELVPA